jgi:hypothetical protein
MIIKKSTCVSAYRYFMIMALSAGLFAEDTAPFLGGEAKNPQMNPAIQLINKYHDVDKNTRYAAMNMFVKQRGMENDLLIAMISEGTATSGKWSDTQVMAMVTFQKVGVDEKHVENLVTALNKRIDYYVPEWRGYEEPLMEDQYPAAVTLSIIGKTPVNGPLVFGLMIDSTFFYPDNSRVARYLRIWTSVQLLGMERAKKRLLNHVHIWNRNEPEIEAERAKYIIDLFDHATDSIAFEHSQHVSILKDLDFPETTILAREFKIRPGHPLYPDGRPILPKGMTVPKDGNKDGK